MVNLYDIKKFIDEYPYMSITPSKNTDLLLTGIFDFMVPETENPEIIDRYELEICIPGNFPRALPIVKEIGGKIPMISNYHVNDDSTLCLGSPIRLLQKIHGHPTLVGFAECCLVPYLYAVSLKIQHGIDFVFGELPHGDAGILEDYSMLFGLKDKRQIIYATKLLATKKRIANKKPCPCGCNKRLGACKLHFVLNEFRKMAPLSWFKAQLQIIK